MADRDTRSVGVVDMLRRYPVKSMLGETRDTLSVLRRGVVGDRAWAVLDQATGKVASAKRPKLWRGLLGCTARTVLGSNGDGLAVEVTLPDGTVRTAGDRELNTALSALIGREVRLADAPPDEAEIDRAHPEEVLAAGLEADVDSDILKLGGGAPPGTFLDYAPMHLITTSTLDAISAALPGGGAIEPIRYRPNVIIRSDPDAPAFLENDWLDRVVRIGESLALRVILLTPRCAIPTLAHGAVAARPDALRVVADHNRIDIPGFGRQPCAGVYVAVLHEGTIRNGDRVSVGAA